jgi:hypothetical protein
MDRDSTLLEEAYLKIAEMYYGHYDDREDPHHKYHQDLSFFIERDILNTTYIVHFYCEGATVWGSPDAGGREDLNYEYENKEILVWDVSKTPEILNFFKEVEEKKLDFVDNLTDEIINKAIINYPEKNPNFIEKYRRNPIYGVLIRDTYEVADDILYDGFMSDLD